MAIQQPRLQSYRDALVWASGLLEAAGEVLTDTPGLDASLLLAHAAGIDRTTVFVRLPDRLSEKEANRFRTLIHKRLTGTPVSYLTGRREFWGLDFLVNNEVLIPRPDTETLVEAALEAIGAGMQEAGQRKGMRGGGLRILDLCCGSGCIGIALASELPEAEVVLSDISSAAVDIALRNRQRLLPADQDIVVMRSDLFEGLSTMAPFDLIVTNPPYLTDDEADAMASAGWEEPDGALRGGKEGLSLIRKIIPASLRVLRSEGYLFIESASSQSGEISRMLQEAGFLRVSVKKDLAGRDRVTGGQWAKKRI
ncbi:peptide chain release factor N(5)-glutamine methyltransferase [Sediminispirochaeta bajacaliforniensis]|uniref:peptide chain release factor N(5)-glutamine methyltransferase n=1 Tax=Sediminispirochaeta bajacaliforniensis TaxID=148 RepID=UPI00035C8965|nr:peptide chain release factor N(5)-glutamine methyltransferase [Sediminispirochaeta bajacaliforniensis]